MKTIKIVWAFVIILVLSSCIKDDIVDDEIAERIQINNSFSNFSVGESIVLDAKFLDNIGMEQSVTFNLKSDNPAIIAVDNLNKEILAIGIGTTNLTVSAEYTGRIIENVVSITVSDIASPPQSIVKVGTIQKTSSYISSGDFEITEISGGIRIKFASNYMADQSLPGFAMFLTNNPNTFTGALKIDAKGDPDGVIYKGAFILDVMGVGINDFGYLTHWCEPFKIKVGEAEIKNK